MYEIKCESAHEFLKKLNTLHDKGGVFRGIGSNKAPLLPAAWSRCGNPNAMIDLEVLIKNSAILQKLKKQRVNLTNTEKLLNCLLHEMELIHSFIEKANQVRLPVESPLPFKIKLPLDRYNKDQFWHEILEEFLTWVNSCEKEGLDNNKSIFNAGGFFNPYLCPNFEIQSVAYAQHHGIPTRYIDFTYNPFKAAWFAYKQYENYFQKLNSDTKNISVLVVNEDPNNFRIEHKEKRINIFEVLNNFKVSDFHNMFYQEGLFIHLKYANKYFYNEGRWPTIDDYIATFGAQEQQNLFFKISLSIEHIDNLIDKLHDLKIDKATLMPSFDHVADYVINKDDFLR